MSASPAATEVPAQRATDRTARQERRRQRTRDAILDAVEPVFRRTGLHAARVEELAEAADVSVGSLYAHFAGKHGIFMALIERALGLFEGYMHRIDDPRFGPLQRVLAGGDAYLRFHLDHPGYFHFFAQGLALTDEAGVADADEVAEICGRVDALLDWFAAQVQAAIDAGEAIPVDPRTFTRLTWGSWNGVIGLAQQPAPLRLSDEEITRTLELQRALLLQALATPHVRGADGAVTVAMPYLDR